LIPTKKRSSHIRYEHNNTNTKRKEYSKTKKNAVSVALFKYSLLFIKIDFRLCSQKETKLYFLKWFNFESFRTCLGRYILAVQTYFAPNFKLWMLQNFMGGGGGAGGMVVSPKF